MSDLTGTTVWVTGAGTGIGRAVALAFAQAGARVALTGRSIETLNVTLDAVTAAGGEAMVAVADVTDPHAVTRAHEAVVAMFGPPAILINNAGANARRRHWAQLSPDDMAMVVDVNLKGPFLCTLAVLPAMRAAGGGTIIHVASVAGTGIYAVTGPAYTAAKHGARAMSATLNAEEGIHGIRSICINPGEVATPILDSRPRPPTAAERSLMVQPEDIAAAAVFAASLPPRTCVADMTVQPTDNAFYRASAHAIARPIG